MAEPIRMVVATHRAAEIPSDDFYLPVHVGRAISGGDLGYQPDDDGQNISERNASYCELTALYWAWQNLESEALGLSHYRRYFRGSQPGPNGKKILAGSEAPALLGRYDIVLAKPRNYLVESIESHYRNGHHGEDLDVLRSVLSRGPAGLANSFEQVMAGTSVSLYNMFLMRRDLFDEYARWLFEVLGEAESQIDTCDRTAYQARTFGYLGERLLNVWVRERSERCSVGYLPVVNTEGEPKVKKAVGMLRRKFGPAGGARG